MGIIYRLSLYLGQSDKGFWFKCACWLERRHIRWIIFRDCIHIKLSKKYEEKCRMRNYNPFNYK